MIRHPWMCKAPWECDIRAESVGSHERTTPPQRPGVPFPTSPPWISGTHPRVETAFLNTAVVPDRDHVIMAVTMTTRRSSELNASPATVCLLWSNQTIIKRIFITLGLFLFCTATSFLELEPVFPLNAAVWDESGRWPSFRVCLAERIDRRSESILDTRTGNSSKIKHAQSWNGNVKRFNKKPLNCST